MKNILVATDLSARSDRAVLRAIKLAEEFNAKLNIVHIIDDEMPRGLIADVKKSVKKEIDFCIKDKIKNIKSKITIVVGDVHQEILKITVKEKTDLIVLGLHRHINDNQPMIGKLIERIIKNVTVPVLVVKNTTEKDYKKILVGVDFNIHSKKSLKTALEIFSDSQFYVLHSYQTPFLGMLGNGVDLENQVCSVAKRDIDEMIEDSTRNIEDKKSLKITPVIKKGYILDVLKEEAIYLKPRLLVLGTHGRTGFARAIVPSATESVLVNPPCDVLVCS